MEHIRRLGSSIGEIMTGPSGMGPLRPAGALVLPPYGDLIFAQGGSHYWPLQTARTSGQTEPDLIGSLNMAMDGGDNTLLAADAGPLNLSGDTGVTLLRADTERYTGSSNYNTVQSFSFSGWYRSTNLSGNEILFSFGHVTSSNYMYMYHQDGSGGLVLVMVVGGVVGVFDPGTYLIADGNWHHVAVTRSYSATNTLDVWKMYLDGVEIGSTTASAMGIAPASTISGRLPAIGGTVQDYNEPYGGDVAHVALRDGGTWSGAEIAAQWAYNKGPYTDYTFETEGGVYDFVVPAWAHSMQIDLSGAQTNNGGGSTGKGGRLQGTLTVTPGETLRLNIASRTGGGTGGTNGGGATDIRRGGTALANRIATAAGGGADATGFGGGAGGHGGGTTGADGQSNVNGNTLGHGGTPSAGGAPSTAFGGASLTGSAGSLGDGGAGGGVGGGGGDGHYGGGGGGRYVNFPDPNAAGGGGGGSSYIDPGATSVTHTQGYKVGAGTMHLTFSA